MIKNITLLILLIFCLSCEDTIDQCPCLTDLQNPIYKGCATGFVYDMNDQCSVMGLYSDIYQVIKYPQEAIMDSVQGIVAVSFDVYEDGSIGNYTAVNDTLGHGLADAAIAAVKTLNNKGFCPARENCEPVVFNYILPIKFILH